jgi:hypothetical protein
MKFPLRQGVVVLTLAALAGVASAQDYKLETVEALPEGVPAAVAAKMNAKGHRVVGRRPLCEVWLAKELPVQADFAPTLAVKYPFTPGQLVGVLNVPRRSELSDFRGQTIEPGVFTLRYGQQPMDGNHIGTSETADFLLALPVAADEDPAPIGDKDTLTEKSAAAAGTQHPAIFSLLPVADAGIKEAGLSHDEANELWVLQLLGAGAKDKKVPLRLVVVGESKG